MHGFRDEHLPGIGMLHQPGSHVYFVSQHPISTARRPSVSARTHRPTANPDLDGRNEAKVSLGPNNFSSDGQRAPDVILMSDWRAKTGVGIAALVSNRYVYDETFVTRKQVLQPANKSA